MSEQTEPTEPIQQSAKELRHNMSYPIKNSNPTALRTCPICLKTYMKCNKWNHNRTQYHKIYADLNNKLRDLLLEK